MYSQSYFHDLGPHILVDLEVLLFPEVNAFRGFADHKHLQVMFAGTDIAGVDALHPPLLQGFEFFVGVYVVSDRRAVQLDFYRVKAERFAADQLHEDRNLCVGRVQQPLFKLIQLGRNG